MVCGIKKRPIKAGTAILITNNSSDDAKAAGEGKPSFEVKYTRPNSLIPRSAIENGKRAFENIIEA